MPALNFQKQFADLVQSGQKTRTIRAKRKDGRWPAYVGNRLSLYTGMRTKYCRLLGKGKVTQTTDITITEQGIEWLIFPVKPEGLDKFAQADGFKDWPAMRDWFRQVHGLPFHGREIIWELDPVK